MTSGSFMIVDTDDLPFFGKLIGDLPELAGSKLFAFELGLFVYSYALHFLEYSFNDFGQF